MNLVGKIFTVLIFVMCIVFASFTLMTHAAHKNWRNETVKLNDQLDKANKDKSNLQQEIKLLAETRETDRIGFQTTITRLTASNRTLVAERNEAQTTSDSLKGELRKYDAALKLANQNLAAANLEREELRKTNRVLVAQIQAVFDKLVAATSDNANLGAEITAVQKRMSSLAELYQSAKTLLEYTKTRAADMAKDPPTGLSGTVTAVQQNYVEISVGYDDGVRKGHRFSVTRPNTGSYVGDIEVIKVDWPNRAVCQPLKATQRDQIQKGDYVQANLSKGIAKGG
jgi:hypothetical protein